MIKSLLVGALTLVISSHNTGIIIAKSDNNMQIGLSIMMVLVHPIQNI